MKPLPPRGYYVEAPALMPAVNRRPPETWAAIVWWTGDRKGSYYWRTDHKSWYGFNKHKYEWTKSHWPCSLTAINSPGTQGPFTFEELTKLVNDPTYGDNGECIAAIGRAPTDAT